VVRRAAWRGAKVVRRLDVAFVFFAVPAFFVAPAGQAPPVIAEVEPIFFAVAPIVYSAREAVAPPAGHEVGLVAAWLLFARRITLCDARPVASAVPAPTVVVQVIPIFFAKALDV
tara:strand:- start:109 stop:453 length:345 start_codon:yes stop_codon:yes gene_type:complete